MKVTVFTTVLGDTDPLRPPTVVNPAVRYVVLADRPLAVRPYVCVPIEVGPEGPCLASRRLKILADHQALEAPDVVLWHDAAFQLRADPLTVIARHLLRADLLAFRHPHRARIEQEADVLARMGVLPAATLEAQVATYRSEGWTDQRAITSTGYSIRRCTPAVRAFNKLWWSEVERWGWRDQMSVDYALWRTGLVVAHLPGHYRDNPYAKWTCYQPGAGRQAAAHAPAVRVPSARHPQPRVPWTVAAKGPVVI